MTVQSDDHENITQIDWSENDENRSPYLKFILFNVYSNASLKLNVMKNKSKYLKIGEYEQIWIWSSMRLIGRIK